MCYIQEGNARYEISAISRRELATIWCDDDDYDNYVLTRIQKNVFEWNNMSTHRQLCQWANTTRIQLSMLV
jgi:hypothetical protein